MNSPAQTPDPSYKAPYETLIAIAGEEAEKIAKDVAEKGNIKRINKSAHYLLRDSFKKRLVDISKLLCEVWLERPRGLVFNDKLFGKNKSGKNPNKEKLDVEQALKHVGIDFPERHLDFSMDPSSFSGSIELKEDLSRGLTLVLKIPYAPIPKTDEICEEVKNYIDKCDQFFIDMEDPFITDPRDERLDFPVPQNPYIPLATT